VKGPLATGQRLLQASAVAQVAGDALHRQALQLAGDGARADKRPNRVPRFEQAAHDGAADEACAAGYKGVHAPSLVRRGLPA